MTGTRLGPLSSHQTDSSTRKPITALNVILNWTEELKRMAAARE